MSVHAVAFILYAIGTAALAVLAVWLAQHHSDKAGFIMLVSVPPRRPSAACFRCRR